VLVVEDDQRLARFLERVLKEEGYSVTAAQAAPTR
jgi:DNA-binding response OmpR family regulator